MSGTGAILGLGRGLDLVAPMILFTRLKDVWARSADMNEDKNATHGGV
jgi:hypothetical protein